MDLEKTREIRINPIIPAESVLIATERGGRPGSEKHKTALDGRQFVQDCPFCPGNEEKTPEEIYRFPAQGLWQLRAVRNLYPVFGDDGDSTSLNMGIHHIINGYGRHEVFIDHPQHGIHLTEMTEDHIAALLRAYRDRMSDLYQATENHIYVMVFKNFGPASGGSIPHTHSQIIAMPVIPANVEMELSCSLHFFQQRSRCIFCTLIDEQLVYEATVHDKVKGELQRRINVADYVVEKVDRFIAIKPFASRYPWEVHVLPREHCHDFRNISEDDCVELAKVLKQVMIRLEKVLGEVQYNFFLHSAPDVKESDTYSESFHWHLEICPRTSIPNGFELGSGLAINTVSPEKAAAQLREVI